MYYMHKAKDTKGNERERGNHMYICIAHWARYHISIKRLVPARCLSCSAPPKINFLKRAKINSRVIV